MGGRSFRDLKVVGLVAVLCVGVMLTDRAASADEGEVWTDQFGTTGYDKGWGVAVDATGVYVTGTTGGVLPDQTGAGSDDVFVRRYDTDGTEVWTRQFGTSSDEGWGGGECHRGLRHRNHGRGLAWPNERRTARCVSAQVRHGRDRGMDPPVRHQHRRLGAGGGGGRHRGLRHRNHGRGLAWPSQRRTGAMRFVRKYDTDGTKGWTRQFGTSTETGAWGWRWTLRGLRHRRGLAWPRTPAARCVSAQVRHGRDRGVDPPVRHQHRRLGPGGGGGRHRGLRHRIHGRGLAGPNQRRAPRCVCPQSTTRTEPRGGPTSSAPAWVIGATGWRWTPPGCTSPDPLTRQLPRQTSAGLRDVFVRKYNTDGTKGWTRQFGTSDGDEGHGRGDGHRRGVRHRTHGAGRCRATPALVPTMCSYAGMPRAPSSAGERPQRGWEPTAPTRCGVRRVTM